MRAERILLTLILSSVIGVAGLYASVERAKRINTYRASVVAQRITAAKDRIKSDEIVIRSSDLYGAQEIEGRKKDKGEQEQQLATLLTLQIEYQTRLLTGPDLPE